MTHRLAVHALLIVLLLSAGCVTARDPSEPVASAPNLVFILADDLRADTLGYAGHRFAYTPNLDSLAARAVRFDQAVAVLSLCSPSRATCLTGHYGSTLGVTTYGRDPIPPGVPTFAQRLGDAGYRTGVTGKWHLGNTPGSLGFDVADTFDGNGRWYGRTVREAGVERVEPGFIEAWIADRSIAFIRDSAAQDRPFVLWHCTQVPHMDHRFAWPATDASRDAIDADALTLPASWPAQRGGKPGWLWDSRSYRKAFDEYGYGDAGRVRAHTRDYLAAVHELDRELGRVLDELDHLGLRDTTYFVFLSDNGWMLGEHGLTSKVVAYEPSVRVPLLIAGPGITPGRRDALVTNADIMPTLLALAGLDADAAARPGRSLTPLLADADAGWRDAVFYEAPTPQLLPRPLFAVRDGRYTYIETRRVADPASVEFVELYDRAADPDQLRNLADDAEYAATRRRLARRLAAEQASLIEPLTDRP